MYTPTPSAWPNTALPIHTYAQLTHYDECAIWGVRYLGQTEFECRTWWTEQERMSLADALSQSQQMIEDVLHYFLVPTFVTGELVDDERTVDQQILYETGVQMARWCLVQAPGIEATTEIDASAAVDHADDPAIVGPLAVATLGSTSEIQVFYPDSDRRIYPSKVTYSGGNVTIEIPRCRLVAPAQLANTGEGVDYDDTDNFLAEVTVRRVYRDPSTNAVIYGREGCQFCEVGQCELHDETACMVVTQPRIGALKIIPATYASSEWTARRLTGCYQHVRLNYLAGLPSLTPHIQNMVLRLGHTLMPESPCGCDIIEHLWRRDSHVPDTLSRERYNCSFGMSDGAWIVRRWADGAAIRRGSIL